MSQRLRSTADSTALLLPSPPAETTTLSLSWAHVLAMAITLVMLVGVIRQLGKRGYIHQEWWRLGWDGLPGGFLRQISGIFARKLTP